MSQEREAVVQVPARVAALLEIEPESIDPQANLFELGLDSIALIKLSGQWRKAGLNVTFAELATTPTLAGWQELLSAATGEAPHQAARTEPVDEFAPFELALMQHAYWVGRAEGQQLGGVAAHFYDEFDGTGVDPVRLEAAVRQVFSRHGMLRVQVLDDGRQQILRTSSWPGLTVHDLRTSTDSEAGSKLLELRAALSHRSLDIAAGEVFDVRLTLLPHGATRVHVNLDMIAADALSLRVLLADLARAYDGKALAPIGYTFAQYQADHHRTGIEAARGYWTDRLATLPAAPQLPVSTEVAAATTVVRRHRRLDPEQFRTIEHWSQRHGLTPAMALAAVFAETLTGWSAEPDFLLNLPLFDREPLHPDVAELVGDFTSSVLLAWRGSQPGSFAERAQRLQEQFHADAAHTAYSGVEVLRDLGRASGARVLAPVVYTSALGLGELFSPEVQDCFGEPSWIISQGPQVWLDAQVTELDGGLLVNWDAREDAFAPGVLDAMFAAYGELLDLLLTGEKAWSSPVRSLLPADQLAIRTQVNDTAVPAVTARLHDGLFAMAAAQPQAVALCWGTGQLTYGELAGRALQVAGQLVADGIEPGELVAVSLPKGPEQAVAVLGVLAAGAAYVPIGVDQPALRRERICEAADVRTIIDSPLTTGPALAAPRPGTDLAYVIYTSGSTGEPKGVELTHTAAMNTIADLVQRFTLGPADRTLAVSALDFDLSVFDLFGPLSVGGAVVFPQESERRDATAWLPLIHEHQVTVLNCVPALLDLLLTAADRPLPLRLVLLGGDWVTTDLPGRLAAAAPGARFVALGGTTETAIHSTVQEVSTVPPAWTSVPYGVPLSNVNCRVVDALGRDRPNWVPGELWIGGQGVARGYRGDPARTADRFVTVDGRRWYRTGDQARYWPDGSLEFLGRTDHQVKVRGHRIELGEVEAALTAIAGQGVAVALGPRSLGAVVTGSISVEQLRAGLAERLPAAMVPDRLAVIDQLPLTTNGKIDRTGIRELLAGTDLVGADVKPPSGPIETAVAEAWTELLGVDGIGREHDFFALGGDSLLATRLVGKLRAAGLDGVSLAELFAHPVLADFAASLRLGTVQTVTPVATAPEAAHELFAPTEVQRAYWLGRGEGFTLGGIGCHFYREYDVDDLDVGRLEAAVDHLVRRHPMLRAVFDSQGNQRVLPQAPAFHIDVVELSEQELRDQASHQIFDPAGWPLFSIKAVRTGRRTRLAVGIDNLVLDALSILRFYSELSVLYADPTAELEPIGLTFRDYVNGLPEPSPTARAYWADRIADLPPGPRLPLRVDPAELARLRFTRREFSLDAQRWSAITSRARTHGLTPSGVLLSAFAEVLGRWSAQPDLTVNLTLFDRREVHPDVGRVMGDFTSLLLVGHRPLAGESWLTTARRTQGELWAALDHREVSAVEVQREIGRRTGDPGFTVPVVFTSALGVSGGELAAPGVPFTEQVWGVSQTPQVWLDHQVVEVAGGISLNWDAVEDLFPEGMLDAMFAAYRAFVHWLSETDWTGSAPDLWPAAQRSVRAAVNATTGDLPSGLLHTAFFARAAADPDAVAVIDGTTSAETTYGELADRALQVAGALQQRGVVPGEPVAITLPKGPEQLVAVLGVLAAGGIYVPIGVDQPLGRRERIHQLAGVRVVLDSLPSGPALTAPVEVDADQLAYVIFTSGSTGEPKGVEVTHRAALNTITDVNTRYDVTATDRVLAISALDFDLSVYDLFGPLSAGAAIVTIDEDARRDAVQWMELISRHQVTLWNTVPALLDMLLVVAEGAVDATWGLRVALVSGDWVGLDLPGRVHALWPCCRFIALGGATEAAIWSNALEVDTVDPTWPSIPYGFPLRNQSYRVVDSAGRDCPDWVPGELWIGGAGVAEGYRGDPAGTARQFVASDNTKWYRTGDLGRYWPDGTLEFLGRADQQVKLRGHRIELGEIEAALTDHPAVAAAVVTVTEAPRRLAAAVVPAAPPAAPSGTGEDASAPTLAFRAGAAAAEGQVVGDFLRQLLTEPLTPVPEFEPVLRMWREWLDSPSGPPDPAAADAHYLELIARAQKRLDERLVDYRAILTGSLDAALLLDDDVLAPAALAAADAGAAQATTWIESEVLRIEAPAVADLGGDGRIARALAARGVAVTGVEATGRIRAEHLQAFDVVVLGNVLHRFPDPGQGVALAGMLVKPGGRLLAIERTDLTPVAMVTAALLDRAYESFDAGRRRARSPMLPGAGWAAQLARAGWSEASYAPVPNSFLNRLSAYWPGRRVPTAADLRAHVAARVPMHMVPEGFETLPWLPLSRNGKVDRAAVGALWADPVDATGDDPEGALETEVAQQWCDLLGVSRFGRQQSFFDHGGDSLQATRFVELVRQRYGVELPLRVMFTARTLSAVTAALAEELGTDTEEGVL